MALAVLACLGCATCPLPADPASALVEKIQHELGGPPTDDSKVKAGIPHGEFIDGVITDSRIYPGTDNSFRVYVPAQYSADRPACLLVELDGIRGDEGTVLDNLIAQGDMPVTIVVGVGSGTIWGERKGHDALRWNRSYEFDSVNENFPNYVLGELLPRVETLTATGGRAIRISREAADRAAMGASTGGIGAFTLAWERPDSFSRVYSFIGTFVSMRGGDGYPSLIRKVEPKAIRIFLEDGSTDAWNPLFGSWYLANQNMEAALAFSGYDVAHAWGVHGHDGRPGMVIFPDVMRWLWRGWPSAVGQGVSANDMLQAILLPGEGWRVVGDGYASASGLASNQAGDVYFSDAGRPAIYRVGPGGTPEIFSSRAPAVSGEAFGPDGTLYGTAPAEGAVVAIGPGGSLRNLGAGIRGRGVLAAGDGALYVTEPGEHPDEPSKLWRVAPDGSKVLMDSGLHEASGVAFSPDKKLLFVAEAATKWVYSYIVRNDGSLADKEPFYWLNMTDSPCDSGAADLAVDRQGTLYVATRMGIQVCDRNGRVRAILPLPGPSTGVRSLCWGGAGFDRLFATDGVRVFERRLRIPGYSQWAAPAPLPPGGGG